MGRVLIRCDRRPVAPGPREQAELGGFPTTIEADEAELAGARRRGEKLRDRDGPLEQALEYRLARKGLLRAAAAALERGANGGELGSTEGGGAAGTAAR